MFATVSYKENMFNMGHGAWLQKLISQIFCNIPPPPHSPTLEMEVVDKPWLLTFHLFVFGYWLIPNSLSIHTANNFYLNSNYNPCMQAWRTFFSSSAFNCLNVFICKVTPESLLYMAFRIFCTYKHSITLNPSTSRREIYIFR